VQAEVTQWQFAIANKLFSCKHKFFPCLVSLRSRNIKLSVQFFHGRPEGGNSASSIKTANLSVSVKKKKKNAVKKKEKNRKRKKYTGTLSTG